MTDYITVTFTFGLDNVLTLSYSNSGQDTASFKILVHTILSYAILKLDTTNVRKELRSIMFYRAFNTIDNWIRLLELAARLSWSGTATERTGALQKLTDEMWYIYLAALNGNHDCLKGKYLWFLDEAGKICPWKIGSWTIIPSYLVKKDVCAPKMTCPSKLKSYCTSVSVTVEDIVRIAFRALAVAFGDKCEQVRKGKFAGIAECFIDKFGVVFFIVNLCDTVMSSLQEKGISDALKRCYIMPSEELQKKNEAAIIENNNVYVIRGRKLIRTESSSKLPTDDDATVYYDSDDDADVAVAVNTTVIPIFNQDGSTNMLTIMRLAHNAAAVEYKAWLSMTKTLKVTTLLLLI